MDDIVTDVNEGWSEEGSRWLPTIQWVFFLVLSFDGVSFSFEVVSFLFFRSLIRCG